MPVTQELADLGQRRPAAKHLRGQGVTEQMSALAWRIDSSARQRAFDERRDARGIGKAHARCPLTDEETTARTGRPPVLEVIGDRFADLCWQRELGPPASFAVHRKVPTFPIDVVQRQRDDFACPQSEPRQQEEDGIIAPASSAPSITVLENVGHLPGSKKLG